MEDCKNDNELYEQFLKGNREAINLLIRRNSAKLYGYIFRMTGNVEIARELVQEVFLRFVRAKPKFESGTKVTTYLFMVARNIAIDHIRKVKIRKHISFSTTSGRNENGTRRQLQEKISDCSANPENSASEGEVREKIMSAVSTLPQEQREVFVLRFLEELEIAEISRITGSNENTVKSRIRYALAKLREELKDMI